MIDEFVSLNILSSKSLYYAGIAGFWLVISGIAGGLVDNWFREKNFHLVVNREFSRLTKRVFSFLSEHIGQISSSFSLAFALAFSPYIGNLLGLDLSIRHVTFASSQLSYMFFLPVEFVRENLPPVLLGLIGIGLINVLVAYSLTFLMLFHSRQMSASNIKKLFFKLFY